MYGKRNCKIYNINIIGNYHPLSKIAFGHDWCDFTGKRREYLLAMGSCLSERMQARVIKRSHTTATGVVISRKEGNVPKPWEGALEQAFYMILDFDCMVRGFEPQPVEILYKDPEGKERSYFPDTLIRFHTDIARGRGLRPLLAEVKKEQSIVEEGPLHDMQTRAGKEFAADQGWEYDIFTEEDIYTPYWQNAKFLCRFANYQQPNLSHLPYVAAINWQMSKMKETTVAQLLSATADAFLGKNRLPAEQHEHVLLALMPCLYNQIIQETIHADLSQLLTPQSVIRERKRLDRTYSIFA